MAIRVLCSKAAGAHALASLATMLSTLCLSGRSLRTDPRPVRMDRKVTWAWASGRAEEGEEGDEGEEGEKEGRLVVKASILSASRARHCLYGGEGVTTPLKHWKAIPRLLSVGGGIAATWGKRPAIIVTAHGN
jgi:hypothetical protein